MEIKLKKRSEIADEFKWRIGDMFVSDDRWQERFDAMKATVQDFGKFRGKLGNAETLVLCLDYMIGAGLETGLLYVYANMKLHEDTNVAKYQGFAGMAQTLYTQLLSAASFVEPEILDNAEAIRRFMDDCEGLKLYGHYLENLLRKKEHILSAEMEKVLADAGEIGAAFENIYSMIHDADMKFGSVINESGDSVELTHGRFIRLLESADPRVRRETFEAYYDSYWKQKNTIAAVFGASVKKDVFFASTRGYESALDMALFEHNIPKDVYLNLIGTVRRFLPELHRYTRLRKRALGLSELHMYDLYVPIVASVDEKVPYAEGKRTMLEGLAPLGSEYTNTARKGLEDGWVDVYENEGKRSGAYSWGSYGCHPYILMNYEDKLDDMFTLAHEVGHAMHSHYSWESQPGVYGDYTIFLAEVASTVNEILLMERLLSQTEDKKKRAYLINQTLEQFRTTVFRQTMFAEFEMAAHDLAEKGEPLTADSLNGIYRKLNEDYYGPDIMLDEKIDLEWGRIPHFYNAFYVYQYATGYSAAVAFANRIKNDSGGEAVKGYIEFLKSGGSAYSIEILKKAGVDMSEPAPVEEALDVFKGLLDQMEGLVDAEGKS